MNFVSTTGHWDFMLPEARGRRFFVVTPNAI